MYEDRPFKQLSLGSQHVLALRHDGTVVAWGDNQYGQCNVPAHLGLVTQVAAGSAHSIALREDGTVAVWGDNRGGECDVPIDVCDVVMIAAGVRQSFAALRNGKAFVWGYNEYGPLFLIVDLPDVVHVSLGIQQSLAVLRTGEVVAWGNNRNVMRTPPATLTDAVAVSIGLNHELALTRNGTVIAWGNNKYGQSSVPTNLMNVTQIFAGNDYSLALCNDGTVAVWGNRERIQYALIQSLRRITHIVPGVASTTAHALLVRNEGQLLGIGTWFDVHDIPQRNDLYQVVMYRQHALALTRDGVVIAWGDNRYLQATVPSEAQGAVQVAVGEAHSVALLPSGRVVVWGGNFDGQYEIPDGLDDVSQIAAASAHTLALRPNGTVVAWGHNTWGQCIVPDDLDDVVAVAAGFAHSLALKRDGTVVAWGANFQGQCQIPEDVIDVVQISASGHSLALKRDGTVSAWGRNDFGQCDVPPDLDVIVAIATGRLHSLFLQRDGRVRAIGKNNAGQCDVPIWLNDAVYIAAGETLSLAIRRGGQLVVWGGNGLDDIDRLVSINNVASLQYYHAVGVPTSDGAMFHSIAGMVMKRYYNVPVTSLGDKLHYMIANAPTEAHQLRPLMQWPHELVFHPFKRHLVGYTCAFIDAPSLAQWMTHMAPSIKGGITMAYWTACALASIHARGYVVGSLTPDDIAVYEDGIVTLLNCDRYQVDDGRQYAGQYRASPYDAPELAISIPAQMSVFQRIVARIRGRSMQQVPQATVYSDAFSLATIIFMMLCQYRHPFDGIPADDMESGAIRSYWAEGIWPYDATQRICKPPPEMNEVYQILPQTLQHLFVRAFTGVPDQRPLPSEWVDVLNEMRLQ